MRRLAIALHNGEIGSIDGTREALATDVCRVLSEFLPHLGHSAESASHLLDMLIARSGLLVERQRGVLAFAHHTFQEYFAAQYLASGSEREHRLFLLESARLWSDWWREVILLYTGSIDDASSFVADIFHNDDGDLFMRHVRLAGICVGEAVRISDVNLRQAILRDVLAVREIALQPQMEVTALAAEYLLNWCKGGNWWTHAVRTRVNSGGAQRDSLNAALVAALNDADTNKRRAAFAALPWISVDRFPDDRRLRLSLDEFSEEDPETAAEILSRLLEKSPTAELTRQMLDLPLSTDSIRESAIRRLPTTSTTRECWLTLLRHVPRATPRVLNAVIESIETSAQRSSTERAVIAEVLIAVSGDDNAAGATATVIAGAIGLPIATDSIGRRLIEAADCGRAVLPVVRRYVSRNPQVASALIEILERQSSLDDVTGVLDVIADTFDAVTDDLRAAVLKYSKQHVVRIRAAVARALGRVHNDDDALDALANLAADSAPVIRSNALCAVADLVAGGADVNAQRYVSRHNWRRYALVRAAVAYIASATRDMALKQSAVSAWLARERAGGPPRQARSPYDLAELRYVSGCAAEASLPDADVFSLLWRRTTEYLAESNHKDDSALFAADYELDRWLLSDVLRHFVEAILTVLGPRHRWERHARRPRVNRVSVLSDSRSQHLQATRSHLSAIVNRDGRSEDVQLIASAVVAVEQDLRQFARELLGETDLAVRDVDVILRPVMTALDHREPRVRLLGTQAIVGAFGDLPSELRRELLARLADDDPSVRDASWDILMSSGSRTLFVGN